MNFKYAKGIFLIVSLGSLCSHAQSSQTVNGVITNYGGYWKSSVSAMNLIKPDSSHELLAFTYNGTMYSTGVNDGLLVAQSETFVPQQYQALPISSLSGTPGANTKVAVGQLYDGVDNGPSSPPPPNNIAYYLTDGARGLNLGTGIANLPAGILSFSLPNLNNAVLGDGIPDILITQIAQPTGGVDYYKMTDINGNIVGDSIAISFSGIDSVGNWTGDFYEGSQNPMTLTAGFTKSDRPLRLWAADLSTFGINSSNASLVKNFVISLNGNSDVAFISYNTAIGTVLPVTYTYFKAQLLNGDANLEWETVSELNSSYFEIETSVDGKAFYAIGKLAAAGNSTTARKYSFVDHNITFGHHYYRLKQVDRDQKSQYSAVRFIENTAAPSDQVKIYPNPVTTSAIIQLPESTSGGTINVYNMEGRMLVTKQYTKGETFTTIDRASLQAGTYVLVVSSGEQTIFQSKFTVR